MTTVNPSQIHVSVPRRRLSTGLNNLAAARPGFISGSLEVRHA
ncbi:hypothetical protein [Pseudomonas sp. CAH-1]|nr:hypothetical protein [Pseudomonas sp. CAH-1]